MKSTTTFLLLLAISVSTITLSYSKFGDLLFKANRAEDRQGLSTPNQTSPINVNTPSSPNVAALEKFVNFPVGNFTGVANISIPIHTVTEGSLSLPISVNYNSSGIKVEEAASWVGLGWALNAGGVISRQVMGGPDEGNNNTGCRNRSGWYKDSGFSSVITKPYILDVGVQPICAWTSSCPNPQDWDLTYEYPCASLALPFLDCKYLDASNGCIDTEPDVFFFNFAGYGGKFYFDTNRKAHVISEQDVLIEPNYDAASQKFISWVITTPDGVKYYFGGTGATETQITESTAGGTTTQPLTSGWYLYKIESPDGNDEITISYTDEKIVDVSLLPQTVNVQDNCMPVQGSSAIVNNWITSAGFLFTETSAKRLTSISSSNETINFVANSFRQDLLSSRNNFASPNGTSPSIGGNAKSLDKIQITKDNGGICKEYNFQTSYFVTTKDSYIRRSAPEPDQKRLRLDAIQEKTCDNSIQKPPYTFSYNASSLPRRLSSGQDHWGFYNGADNNESMIPNTVIFTQNPSCGNANRNPSHLAENGILKKIIYPTGGSRELEYELHKIDIGTTINTYGGLRIKKVTTNDGLGNVSTTNYSYNGGYLYINPVYAINTKDNSNQTNYWNTLYPQSASYWVLSSNNLRPQEAANGSHIGYNSVTVKDGTTNGETQFVYHLHQNASIPSQPRYPTPPAYMETGRGSLHKEIKKDKNGNIVSEIVNTYKFDEIGVATARKVATVWTNVSPVSFQVYTDYTLKYRRHRLSQQVITQDGITTTTDYTYGKNHNNPIETQVTNSNGTIHISKIKYSKDYQEITQSVTAANVPAFAIKKMQEQNIIIPIEQTTLINKGSGRQITSGAITLFKYDPISKAILPDKSYSLEITAPIAETNGFYSSVSSNGLNFNMNVNYVHKATLEGQDEKGNILQYRTVGGQPTSFIWGHNRRLPVAKIVNSEYPKAAYSSFEVSKRDAGENGGIFIFRNNNPATDNGWEEEENAVTGKKCIRLQQVNNVTRRLQFDAPNGSYIVSFWYKAGQANVSSNGQNFITTPNTTEWRYAETEVVLTGSQTIQIQAQSNASVLVDEVRIYPKGALMTTFSYDDDNLQLVSINDENNVSSHFAYDGLERLAVVRDQDKNIVKTYNYEYQQNNNALNKIQSNDILVGGVTAISQINTLTVGNIQKVIQYLDGLGREIQNVAVAQSPLQRDVVQYITYDEYGRQEKNYLPFTENSNGGAYRPNAAILQQGFYTQYYAGDGSKAFSRSIFDGSPLNRVVQQGAQGGVWQPNENNPNNAKTVKSAYRPNTAADNVRNFANNTFYPANSLLVQEVTDENGVKSRSYTDKIGRSILSEKEAGGGKIARTYQLYDDFGNIVTVIPPKAVEALGNTWNLSSIHALNYEYRYDARKRLVEKKIPSAAPNVMFYDAIDRLILSQDGNQRANNKWTFTKYDELNRPVLSGVTTLSNINPILKTNTPTMANNTRYVTTGVSAHAVPTSGFTLHESPNNSTQGYTNTAFPNTSDVLSVTYYDNYDFDRNGTLDYSFVPALSLTNDQWFQRTKGKLIGSKVKVLDNSNKWLTTVTFYDKYGRVIQVKGEHHLSGEDLTTTKYDFVGRVLATERKHTKAGQTDLYIWNDFTYDHAGRVLYQDLTIDEVGGLKPQKIRVAANRYNELSQLIEKKLHTLADAAQSAAPWQKVDYNYNIRGWLTDINDVGFGSVTVADVTDNVVSGLVRQIVIENIRVTLENNNEPALFESNLSNELKNGFELEETLPVTRDNIETVLSTLNTHLQSRLISMGVEGENVQRLVDDETLRYEQVEWRYTSGSNLPTENDLFSLHLDYTLAPNYLDITRQFNGNIAAMTWRVRGQNKKAYSFEYDPLNRLTEAEYREINNNNQIISTTQGAYSTQTTYDLNGNILTMYRKGAITFNTNGIATAYGIIDNMEYSYTAQTNELQKIREIVTTNTPLTQLQNLGFKDNGLNITDYSYDANGNLTQDANKDINTTYNHLNLPTQFQQGSNQVTITYDAAGVKLTKTTVSNTGTTIKHYIGGIEYNNNNNNNTIEAVYHSEGRAVYIPNGNPANGIINNFRYEYTLKDHLGNSRVMFSDLNGDGQLTPSEILQAEHYYPFGMSQQGHSTPPLSENAYTYNGKELNTDFGIALHDYGARQYDAANGRWTGIDPLAEQFSVHSPYCYAVNNPVLMIDPDGRSALAGNASGYRSAEDIYSEVLEREAMVKRAREADEQMHGIFIRAGRNDDTNYTARTLALLQSLTDDDLGISTHTMGSVSVKILKKNDGKLTEGTKLIRSLIEPEPDGKKARIVITHETLRHSTTIEDININKNAYTIADNPLNASNGIGTGSTILFSPDVKASFTAEDMQRYVSEANTVLAHELVHADYNRLGTRKIYNRLGSHFIPNGNELQTIIRENTIRLQLNQRLRSTEVVNHH